MLLSFLVFFHKTMRDTEDNTDAESIVVQLVGMQLLKSCGSN